MKKSFWITGIIVIIIILALVIYFNNKTSNFVPKINSDDIQYGNPDAKITILEFTDLSCPICAAAEGSNQQYINQFKTQDPTWTPALPLIFQNYIETGKAKIVIKYFPGHGLGEQAQLIGWCLYTQNKSAYLTYQDEVFANQDKVQDTNYLMNLTQSLGADNTQIKQCLDSGKYNSKITDDTNYGKNLGIRGTPSFYIGNQKVEGAYSYPYFENIINSKL